MKQEQRRARRANIQAAAKRRSKDRQCGACARLNALVRLRSTDGTIVVTKCRYCQHERVSDIYATPFTRNDSGGSNVE